VPSGDELERFYAELMGALEDAAIASKWRGTLHGAAVVVKRVGLAHGVRSAALLPLPRPNRAEVWERGGS
jgi:hypothetical protein